MEKVGQKEVLQNSKSAKVPTHIKKIEKMRCNEVKPDYSLSGANE